MLLKQRINAVNCPKYKRDLKNLENKNDDDKVVEYKGENHDN